MPRNGLDAQLDRMHAWFDQHTGLGQHFLGSQAWVGMADVVVVYFMDAEVAAELVDCFACELVAGRKPLLLVPGHRFV